jgi:hypothetical protein
MALRKKSTKNGKEKAAALHNMRPVQPLHNLSIFAETFLFLIIPKLP